MPARTRWNTTAGSMSPDRVPITSPSNGDRPIDVITDRPPSTAQADAPLPRCRVTRRSDSSGWSRARAASWAT